MGVTVRQKPAGSAVWWVFIHHAGQRRARRVGTGKPGKRLAEASAIKIQARLLDGDVSDLAATPPPPPKAMTFAQVAEAWGPWYQGLYPTRFNTSRNHTSALRAHLIPHFGVWPITYVTRAEVQKFIAIERSRVADTTLQTYLVTLRLVLDYAVERGDLAANPMRGGRLWRPEQKGDEPDPFDQEELAVIVASAEDLCPPFGLMIRAWAQSGMRSGELRGLKRGDLDPLRGEVKVERTLTHGRLGPAKTLRSRRTASLLYPVVEPTADWRPTTESRSVLDRLDRVVPLNPAAPLFGSITKPGHPMQEPELGRWWSRALARTKVRPRTPENLRHTFVSILLSRGAPLLQVAAQAGHTPAVMLGHYSKWLPTASATPAISQPGATPAQPAVPVDAGALAISGRHAR
jgi:integrase